MRTPKQLTQSMALAHYRTARWDLLLLIILTAVNIVFLLTGSETLMLFSAAIPYYAVAIAWYNGPEWFLQGSLIFAAVILALYLICWFFSKKHHGWMIGAAVLFTVDTLALLVLYQDMWLAGIMDFLIHAVVLFYLIRGSRSAIRLRNLPETSFAPEAPPVENTAPIRRAEETDADCILAQAQTDIGFICYRSVGHVRELVINGYVYDEVELLVETAHELRAVYAGHWVQAGMIPGSTIRYINLDGQQIVRNL